MTQPATPTARLALDAILGRPTAGIPSWMVHVMEHSMLERLAGMGAGEYLRDPERVYVAAQRAAGVCMIDQFIPKNPLTMGAAGFETARRGATTGAAEIVLDGLLIDSPEAVAAHLDEFVFPATRQAIAEFDEEARAGQIRQSEADAQARVGAGILKVPYAVAGMPILRYDQYGYANYFMAYALYPEVMEKDFSLTADLATLRNRAAARAYVEGALPPLLRLDHDMADSRGTLVDIRSLDRMWLPHLDRCLDPLRKAGVRMIWHCDGNLMALVPRLLEIGLKGFQGFQYEDGMDYPAICRMRDREGEGLTIIAGVSVTRTLPRGTPQDVRRELAWLVEHGPRAGLMLGCSSSVAPGVPWENLQALVEGLLYYRDHGRG
jgi:hypothetical protein